MKSGEASSPPALPNVTQTRWSIAFAAALMNAVQSGAFFFTPTTLMPLIVADFQLPLSLSTVPIAVGKVAYVLLLIPGGMLVDHFGPRRCVFFGVAGLAAFMTFYAAFVSSFWWMMLLHILLATVASVSGVPVYSIFIAQWFEGGIGLAMGLVLAGYSAAGTAIPAFLGSVASTFGWRVAMGCMCGLLWCVGLPVTYFFLHEYQYTDDDVVPELEEGALEADGVQDERTPLIPVQERVDSAPPLLSDTGLADSTSWTFVGFAFSYILLQYCFGCFGENVMFFLTIDRGMTLALASLYFSALNFAAFTAKVVGGYLGDHFDRFHVASASSGLAAVGIVFLFLGTPGLDENNIPYLTSSPIAVLIFTVLFGFGYGATFNCLYALTPIVFGKQNLGRTQSTLFGLGLAGNAVGSVLTGVLRNDYDTYQRPFLIAALACTANFFVFNVTRLTLGGSLEGLKSFYAEQQALALSSTFQGMAELEAEEEAFRRRIGDLSDSGMSPRVSPGMSPRMSPPGSLPGLNKGSGLLGAAFIPVTPGEGFPNSTSIHSALGAEVHLEGMPTSNSLAAISRSSSRHSGTGMQIEQGFPIVRDWSSSSLRAYLRRSPSHGGGNSPVLRPQKLKKSSTMEAIIESGILSASLEAAGYLGSSPGHVFSRNSPISGSPLAGMASPLHSKPYIGAGPSRQDADNRADSPSLGNG